MNTIRTAFTRTRASATALSAIKKTALPAASFSPVRHFASKPAVYPEDSIYSRTSEDDIFRTVQFPEEDQSPHAHAEFRATVNELFAKHVPSQHPLFANLKNLDPKVASDPAFLEEFYKRYQAAMHCTRVMVWFTPFLDNPIHRQRKLSIILDDDSMEKNSHHKQLENMFRRFGCEPLPQEYFGDLTELKKTLDPASKKFVETVERLYTQNTGAWCIAEVLSDDWLSALADSFSPFYPNVMKEEYFDEVFTGHVEIEHMLETVALTEDIFARRPEVVKQTIANAREMAQALDDLWSNLDDVVTEHAKRN